MSISEIADPFEFTEENQMLALESIKKYPDSRKQSAVMPILDIAQRQNDGWLSQSAIEYVADYLDMPYIRVWEIVTFYSMYYTKPVGKNFVQVCTTTPCWLRGSDNIVKACKEMISPEQNIVSKSGLFSWMKVECLGSCGTAPVVQINNDYHEELSIEKFDKLVENLQ